MGENHDIFIATCYLNPSQSITYGKNIENLMEDICLYQIKGRVMINGDLNGRTGNITDIIPYDKYDMNDCNTCVVPHNRNSQDVIVNERGKFVLEMCKALDLCIVNGRKLGDPFGKFTCFQWNGHSVADYLITSHDLFNQIRISKVGEFIPWISDHCPITFELEINSCPEKNENREKNSTLSSPKCFIWSNEGLTKFRNALESPNIQGKLNSILALDDTNPNQIVGTLSELLIDVAEKVKIKKAKKSSRDDRNPPWFNETCYNMKNDIRSLGKKLKQDSSNPSVKMKLTKLKRMFKKTVKTNKSHFKQNLVNKLDWSRNDSNKFWKLLDDFEKRKNDEIFKQCISEDRWVNHFKSILQNTKNDPLPNNTSPMGPLDYEVSDEELMLSAYILKPGKATGYDCISNEMINCLFGLNPNIFKKLFKSLLNFPSIIKTWQVSMITTIHKKGSKINPDNYRGISLISCLAKYFVAFMNQRLMKYVAEKGILSKAQLGFLPGNRTSDALLILNNLIEYYCKKRNTYIFGCFVDFHKAFDSIPRGVLFQKLLNNGITGNFYECLVKLYTNDRHCVKINDRLTETFVANQGVKQGCVLSPLLFNIFLSDLQDTLEKNENYPISFGPNERIGCLIWADDLVLLSKTEEGLQNMINDLGIYAENNGLSVNVIKTKVMIFNKTGRLMRRNLYLNNIKLDTVRQYKYLGFIMTPSGEISSGLHDLKDRALRAFMKIKNKLGQYFRSFPRVSIKLFNSLVKPILLYASDFWGILKLPKNNPIENLFHHCCKQILGVQKQTTNVGVLLELGEVPINLYAIKNTIKNWERIAIQKKANELVTQCYDHGLLENHPWPYNIRAKLTEIGMMESFMDNNDDGITHIKVFQRLRDMFHQNTFASFKSENNKLRTYGLFKTNFGFENYLNICDKTEVRISFTKFRLSNHMLMIEKGRHQKVNKNLRFCPFCPNKIEDELHFLLDCKCYEKHRTVLLRVVSAILNQPIPRDKKGLFIILMSNERVHTCVAQYIYDTLQIREFLMKHYKNNM